MQRKLFNNSIKERIKLALKTSPILNARTPIKPRTAMILDIHPKHHWIKPHCQGVSVHPHEGGSAITFHFWNKKNCFNLENFPQLLQDRKFGKVRVTMAVEPMHSEIHIFIKFHHYDEFKTHFKEWIWDHYRMLFKRNKGLRPKPKL